MVDEESPSRRTLEEAPGRVLDFLIGVAKSPVIRAILATCGYDAEQHAYAWSLLAKLAAYGPPQEIAVVDAAVRGAVAELDAWDEPNFTVVRAMLERLHPGPCKFLFDGLSASQGPSAVVGVELFLDRLDALENAPARKATRKEDHAALATLSKRGYPKDERARLRSLVELAKKADSVASPSDDARLEILRELYGFISDWGTTAKVKLKRRDHQIQVGVAKRKKPKKKGAAGEAGDDDALSAASPGSLAERASPPTEKAPPGDK